MGAMMKVVIMREMNFQEAKDIRNRETKIIDCQEMRLIRSEGGDETHPSWAALAAESKSVAHRL